MKRALQSSHIHICWGSLVLLGLLLFLEFNPVLISAATPTRAIVPNGRSRPASVSVPGGRRVRGTAGGKILRIAPSSSPSTTTTTTATAFDFNDENKRLLRLESASPISYLYRYRAPKTTASSPRPQAPLYFGLQTQANPRVFLRHNGQSGVIQRRRDNLNDPEDVSINIVPVSTTVSTTTTTETTTTTPPPNTEDLLFKDVEPNDFPYHYYLDFDENNKPSKLELKQENDEAQDSIGNANNVNLNVGEYLSPQPSENINPSALTEQQSFLWNQFVANFPDASGSTAPTTTVSPPALPAYLNEIVDNYTIPSLRDYRFPEFKTTTTEKPNKPDFLNPYEFFSEEDLENVADLDLAGDHSKYFVKTKPRDVSSSVANLYNSFYYEPPSYSTKTQPLPVKAKFPLAVKDDGNQKYKWNHNELNFKYNYNYFNELVTLPMAATVATTPVTSSSSTANYDTMGMEMFFPSMRTMGTDTATTPSPLVPAAAPPALGTNNFSEYEGQGQFHRMSSKNNDVATAESIALLANRDNFNLNVIPDSYKSVETTTLPPTQFTITTPTSTTSETTNIPGMPGIDYPIFDEIPHTGFDCTKQRYKGFFADIETKCQVWHYCDFADGHSSFLCPNGTLFSQVLLTCDWWFNVDCLQAQQLYVLNERLYRYIKPPKPSFPEDYHGPQVDLWLKKQLELGLLPKIKRRGKLVEKPVPTTLREKIFPEDSDTEGTTPSSSPNITSLPNPQDDMKREQ